VKKNILFVGLYVHADTIVVTIAKSGRHGQVYSMETVANWPDSIGTLIRKLIHKGEICACYKAGLVVRKPRALRSCQTCARNISG
jgi:hypothetical protein